MYWYNPRTRSTESSPTPETDEEAMSLLKGDLNSDVFIAEYQKLRSSSMDIEQALVFTGHEIRLRHLEYQPPGQ